MSSVQTTSKAHPRVGIGVIILNEAGEILVGKRRGSHAPFYSIPGGALELGESFEHAAEREVAEETGLRIFEPRVIGVVNDLETFRADGVHFVSAVLVVSKFEGEPKLMEPHKCDGWFWCDPQNLPQPHFWSSREAVSLALSTSEVKCQVIDRQQFVKFCKNV